MTIVSPLTEEECIEVIARACHDATGAWNAGYGSPTLSWETNRVSVMSGVRGVLAGNTPEESHLSWLRFKQDDGWVYGVDKDPVAKTHPCMVPYDQLSEFDRVKDTLFVAIVKALAPAMGLHVAYSTVDEHEQTTRALLISALFAVNSTAEVVVPSDILHGELTAIVDSSDPAFTKVRVLPTADVGSLDSPPPD